MSNTYISKFVQATSNLLRRTHNGPFRRGILARLEMHGFSGCQDNRGGIAAYFRAGCLQLRVSFLDDGGIDMPGRIPFVRVTRYKLQHARSLRANQDGWPAF